MTAGRRYGYADAIIATAFARACQIDHAHAYLVAFIATLTRQPVKESA